MEDRSFVPVVFLANVCQDEKYRHERPEGERAPLECLEESLTDSRRFEIARTHPDGGVFFLDLFRKYRYAPSVSILHVTGDERSCRQGWKIQTGMGAEVLHYRQLSSLIAALPGLQLVILSGCAQADIMQMLIGLDIPAVIVTDELEGNPLTLDILDQFYHALSQENSIREAFDRARSLFPYRYQYRETHYDLASDRFSWPDQEAGMIPWGLYYLTENAARLNWCIPTLKAASSALPAPPKKETHSQPEPAKDPESEELVPLSLLKWGLVVTVFLLAGILGLDLAEWALPLKYERVEQVAGMQDGRFQVRMFPLVQYPDCKKSNPAYTEAIYEKIHALALQDSQHISLSFVNIKACPEAYQEAETWLKTDKAHMVFWGNYTESEGGQVKVNLHVEYVRRHNAAQPTERTDLVMEGSQEWFSGYSDATFPMIQDLIYLAAGTYLYDRREYELCLDYLSRIPLSEDTTYIRVDRLMAHAYMAINKYERAARRYEHILSIQPGNAHAYLERGEMFAAIGKYDDAMLNFERAIYFEPGMTPAYRGRATLHMHTHNYEAAIMDAKEMTQLNPDDPLAYSMLANLYALIDNKSLFLRYMEIALRKGYAPQEFMESAACKKYRNSRGFQALIETYQR